MANIEIRPLKAEDFPHVVEIDEKVLKQARPEYYESKFNQALNEKNQMVLSMVAEVDDTVVGFIMCDLFVGELGTPADSATLITIGVHPDYQRKGISKRLMQDFISHLRRAGVEKVNTLVDWNDWRLLKFFNANGFEPARTISLELNLK